jgi:nucleotide-binding universal stress UspA family protein
LTKAGEFQSVVAETTRSLRPILAVVPELFTPAASWLRDLALECETPILLAREIHASGSILAATNLEHPTFPVLRAGAFLSASFGAPAVFVHNFDTAQPNELATRRADAASIVGRLDALVRAAESLGVESQNVVTLRSTADEGVLSLLRTAHADVVVLGARKRVARGVPGVERIIDEITSSVLLVPVDATALGDDEHVGDAASQGGQRLG